MSSKVFIISNVSSTGGGTIWNGGTIGSLQGNFLYNTVSQSGAAIRNYNSSGIVNIVANTRDSLYYGNKQNSSYNDIYNGITDTWDNIINKFKDIQVKIPEKNKNN